MERDTVQPAFLLGIWALSKTFCEMLQKRRVPRRTGRDFTVSILLGSRPFCWRSSGAGRGHFTAPRREQWFKDQCCYVLCSHLRCHRSAAHFSHCPFSTPFLTQESGIGWGEKGAWDIFNQGLFFTFCQTCVSSLASAVPSASLSPVTLRNCGVSAFDVS